MKSSLLSYRKYHILVRILVIEHVNHTDQVIKYYSVTNQYLIIKCNLLIMKIALWQNCLWWMPKKLNLSKKWKWTLASDIWPVVLFSSAVLTLCSKVTKEASPLRPSWVQNRLHPSSVGAELEWSVPGSSIVHSVSWILLQTSSALHVLQPPGHWGVPPALQNRSAPAVVESM